ncbi:MAG: RidA family protein [Candidatus Dadabacteria bacterium]|nr:MAG: RidA family protein [Candidatus Dadabacteria bacterium]
MEEKIKYIENVEGAPKAVGPYSIAAAANGFVYLSGQIPINPDTGEFAGEGIEEQTEQVMKNLKTVLSSLDLSFKDVVKTTIYLTDLGNFSIVNEIYSKWLEGAKPARATVQVAALPLGAKVEIEMIAVKQ